jgi:hypothetical protein
MRLRSPRAATFTLSLALGLWSGLAQAEGGALLAYGALAYDANQRAALAYYAQHYPAYYQRYYGGLRIEPAPAPAPALPIHGEADRGGTVDAESGADRPGMVEGESDESGQRTLGGHTFHYPRLIESAFTAANFYVGSSVEWFHQADATARYRLSDGSEDSFDYDMDLAFVRLRYGVDFQLAEPFSFGLDADFLVEVGANRESILVHGGNTGYDFRPNMKLRVFRSEQSASQLALRAHATLSGGVRAVPQGLASSLGTQNAPPTSLDDVDLDSMSVTRTRQGGGGTLAWAQGLGQYAGFQVAVAGEAARSVVSAADVGDVAATAMRFSAGVAPSLNFAPSFPVGLTLEYRFDLDRAAYEENAAAEVLAGTSVVAHAHHWAAGLYYTGRRDLMLGWIGGLGLVEDGRLSTAEAGADAMARLLSAQFDMRYFF